MTMKRLIRGALSTVRAALLMLAFPLAPVAGANLAAVSAR